MAGRPKRDASVLRALLLYEFQWQLTFAGMRFGWPGGDTSIPDPNTAGLKWLRSSQLQLSTEDDRKFWENHYRAHIKDADEEFTQKIVRAEPRDLASEPELWKTLCRLGTGAAEIRNICRESKYLKPYTSYPCPTALFLHAKEFCEAKRDERYPDGGKQNRKSSEDKRVDYLARVMAGISLPKPMSPSTADDVLRKIKHPGTCTCWRCRILTSEAIKRP